MRPVDNGVRSINAVGKAAFDSCKERPLALYGVVIDTTVKKERWGLGGGCY